MSRKDLVDGFVEISLYEENSYTESARYVLDCEVVVGTLKRKTELSEYDAWFNVKDDLLVLGVSFLPGRLLLPGHCPSAQGEGFRDQ